MAVVIDERGVSIGRGRWLQLRAEHRGERSIVVHLCEMHRRGAGLGAVPLEVSRLEIPPHALEELAIGLWAIATKLKGRRT